MNAKKPGVRWLRKWHAAIVRECGTDDIAVLIAGAICLKEKEKYLDRYLKSKFCGGCYDPRCTSRLCQAVRSAGGGNGSTGGTPRRGHTIKKTQSVLP
jgi:hypothetical protein